jgi:colanic acid/amylovoran biosynthesis glycosyltransferase
LRLAIFTNLFPNRISTFFARDICGLLKSGIEVDIFSFYPLDSTLWRYVPNLLNESVLERNKVHHISFAQSLRFIKPWPLGKFSRFLRDTAAISASAARFGFVPLVKSAYVFPKAWAWAQQYTHKYDHILAYWGNYAATCAYIFHRVIDRQIPFSIFVHAGVDLYNDQVYMRQKLTYADNIITCNEFNRQFIQEHFLDIFHLISGKIYVHHHGLDLQTFSYEPEKRLPQRIIAVGALEKYKGFDYLLRAVHELITRCVDIEIELVGDGKEAKPLKDLTNKLRITEKVKFKGWVPPEEVQTAMRQATILVHPSPHLGDGVPNVIKEAMAVGTPVIASDIAGIPEVLDRGRYGILVPPKDVNALVTAIERLLADQHLRQHYAQAARSYAEEKFDLWRNGRRLADLLCSTRRLKPVRSHG